MSWQGPLIETVSYEYRVLKQEGGKLPAVRTGAAPILHDGNLYLFKALERVGRTSDVWRYSMKEKNGISLKQVAIILTSPQKEMDTALLM